MNESIKLGDGYWAFKENALLAYNDENNNFKPIDLNSTRATTATRVNKLGLIESVNSGVPRVDYLNNSKGSLLVEPQRTNLFLRSEEFENASWNLTPVGGTGLNPTVTANAATAPDGTNTADRVIFNLNGGTTISDISRRRQLVSIPFTGNGTISFYVRSFDGASNYIIAIEDANGMSGSISVTGEWTRITKTATTYTSGNNIGVGIGLRGGQPVPNSDTADILIWGAQLELGSNATSYIPTVASTVTRNADVISKTGISDLIGQSEGTMFLDFESLSNSVTNEQFSLSDGTDANTIKFVLGSAVSGIRAEGRISSVNTFAITFSTSDYLSRKKIAVAYKENDFVFYVNGVQIGTDSLGAIPPSLSQLKFSTGAGTNPFFGKVYTNQVYKTRLTNGELAILTTL